MASQPLFDILLAGVFLAAAISFALLLKIDAPYGHAQRPGVAHQSKLVYRRQCRDAVADRGELPWRIQGAVVAGLPGIVCVAEPRSKAS